MAVASEALRRNVHDTLILPEIGEIIEFGTDFLRYQFLVTNRICSIFVPVYDTGILIRVFSADLLYVCDEHKYKGFCRGEFDLLPAVFCLCLSFLSLFIT